LVVIISVVLVLKPGAPSESPGPAQASPPLAVDFTVKDMAGEPVSLSDFRGQVVLVNFWATWCSPCKEEMPVLDAYYRQYQPQGFLLLGINVSDRPEEATAFVKQQGYSYPILFDPPGNVLIDLGIQGLPASLLVDREGGLVTRWLGPLTAEMLDLEVMPHLAETP
jgi:thiol-disulfide isomerase/thioredoxin